jgi:preprotein translocase subunit SecA
MANRDPVVEYQREGYDMFNAMLDGIKEESVGFLFNLEVKTKEQQEAEAAEKQAKAEAEALVRAQAGTQAVLARQAAAQAAAAKAAAAPTAAPAEAPAAPAAGNGAAPAKAPAIVPSPNGSGTTTGSARRTGKPAPVTATAAPAEAAEPTDTGTGPELAVKGLEAPKQTALSYSAPSLDASTKDSGRAKAAKSATVTGTKETPRNAPCPCGSGKKFKQCHGAAGN